MNRKIIVATAFIMSALSFSSCSDDESDILPGPPDYELMEQPTKGAYIMTLQGKVDETLEGEYANMVYVDLSAQQQQLVDRTSWHLGFYCGETPRVTLNQSLSRVYSTGEVDFASVTEENAKSEDFPDLAGGMMSFPKDQVITDATNGDLSGTAFGDISTDEAKSEVFLLATEGLDQSAWYKLKITAVAGGYKLAYGNINATVAKETVVKKDSQKTFVAFSLENDKIVELPQQWDLMWSKAIAVTTMPNGKRILGPSSDVVTTNRQGGVEVAEVFVKNSQQIRDEFEQFTKTNADTLTFRKDADVLGTDWRLTPMPNAVAPGPKADRFYVFKDGEGKLFKLRFLHFCEEDGGERGKPMMEAAPLN